MLLAALSLAIWVYLLFGHGRFWQDGQILLPVRPDIAPPVTVIVPARDEEGAITRAITSLLAQDYPGELRIVLVDDRSRDGTLTAARAFTDPRLTIIEGSERPVGWSGKLWAQQQGIQTATTPLLFLTDADIEHQPAHLSALVARLQEGHLDLVSEMVQLNCASFAEHALVPAFAYFFAMLYPFAQVNDAGSRTAAAAGGTMLIRAEALARIGGLASMRAALIDDVTLATRVKQQGRIWLGHSRLATSIRPYPRAEDVWRMVSRTAYTQLRYSPVMLTGTVLGMALVFLLPPLAAIFGHGGPRLAGLLAWVACGVSFAPTLRRFRLSVLWAPFLPAAALFYTAATIGSAADHMRRRGVVWKQRSYS